MRDRVEWPTLVLLAACYGLWVLGTTWLSVVWLPLGMAVLVVTTALHSSLCHEMLHGHPFRSRFWNGALVFPALSVTVPYLRFRDTHLAHHQDSRLTDPYDDPESNYLDPAVWGRVSVPMQCLFKANNTLAGRLFIGPAIGTVAFLWPDLRALARGDRQVWIAWLLHVPAVAVVVWWMVAVAAMPLWAWGISVYAAHGLLKIRTFLEHQAHEEIDGRTVIVEDRGPLALIFLNNNLHLVHHLHAAVPWYRLPQVYRANRDRYLTRNGGYLYRSYGEIFRQHFWRAKDPVPHPLFPPRG